MSYLFTVQLSGGGQHAVRTGGGDELPPPTTGGGGQYTMIVEPEMLGTRLDVDAGVTEAAAVVIGAGQQLDLTSLVDLGGGVDPPARVHVFLEDD
jgi:hypothetical protein